MTCSLAKNTTATTVVDVRDFQKEKFCLDFCVSTIIIHSSYIRGLLAILYPNEISKLHICLDFSSL